ncbi:hypothetical protein B0H14DRAFT_3472207 [Mycena olivaceomarginata]|nr:hypothetical protein B0H14DRAFT_3472207 [Mycena olivaceomarginata]
MQSHKSARHQTQEEDLSDKDDAEAEKFETSSNHAEDDDFAVEEDEDLQNVPVEVLSRTFAQEVSAELEFRDPHWQPLQDDSEAEDADDRADHAQPPSRPPSLHELRIPQCPRNFQPLLNVFLLCQKTKRTQKTSSRASASDAALPPTKARGKRELARDAEGNYFFVVLIDVSLIMMFMQIPRWMESIPSTGSPAPKKPG